MATLTASATRVVYSESHEPEPEPEPEEIGPRPSPPAKLPIVRVQPRPRPAQAPTWSLATLAGRMVELSAVGASAALTFTALLLHEAQRQGEPVAWVQGQASTFFPPDLAAVGVDLQALAVIRPTAPGDLGKAVSHLLRSGAFGLVVVDVAAEGVEGERLRSQALPAPLQSRLERTAALHGTCLLCLTAKAAESASLGPLVSWRGEARRVRVGGRLMASLVALKDKRGAPGWRCEAELLPLAGLA